MGQEGAARPSRYDSTVVTCLCHFPPYGVPDMPQGAHVRLRLTQHEREGALFHGRQDADRDSQMEEPGRAASEQHHGTTTDR